MGSRVRIALSVTAISAITSAIYCYTTKTKRNNRRQQKDKEHRRDESDDDTKTSVMTEEPLSSEELPVLGAVHQGEDTVVINTCNSHIIEGKLAAKEDIPDNSKILTGTCQADDGEMMILTFSLVEEAATTSTEPEESTTTAATIKKPAALTKEERMPSIKRPAALTQEARMPSISESVMASSQPPESVGAVPVIHVPHATMFRKDSKKPKSRHMPCLSEGVIMINQEDLDMMGQLMLQLDDDQELFDCGDECREYRSPGRRKVTMRR